MLGKKWSRFWRYMPFFRDETGADDSKWSRGWKQFHYINPFHNLMRKWSLVPVLQRRLHWGQRKRPWSYGTGKDGEILTAEWSGVSRKQWVRKIVWCHKMNVSTGSIVFHIQNFTNFSSWALETKYRMDGGVHGEQLWLCPQGVGSGGWGLGWVFIVLWFLVCLWMRCIGQRELCFGQRLGKIEE